MLKTLLLTANTMAEGAIAGLLVETGMLSLVVRLSTLATAHEIVRQVRTHEPHIILLDCNDLRIAIFLAQQIRAMPGAKPALIGFRPGATPQQQEMLAQYGIDALIPEPFEWRELEPAVYDAIHRTAPIDSRKFLAFLPAKAGSGCSTVALNTAGALSSLSGNVLLMDSDRRSGIISVLLNLTRKNGLLEALRSASELTNLEWEKCVVRALGLDLLLADPSARSIVPSWADYLLLLRFVESKYDHIVVDLPELVNPGTAEVVRAAGSVFVVCTPEIPALRLAEQRCNDLMACGIPASNIHVLLNRVARGGMTAEAIEQMIGREVFTTIANDYRSVHESIVSSRLVSTESPFAKNCEQLARRVAGLQPVESNPRFSFLRNFSLAS